MNFSLKPQYTSHLFLVSLCASLCSKNDRVICLWLRCDLPCHTMRKLHLAPEQTFSTTFACVFLKYCIQIKNTSHFTWKVRWTAWKFSQLAYCMQMQRATYIKIVTTLGNFGIVCNKLSLRAKKECKKSHNSNKKAYVGSCWVTGVTAYCLMLA